MSFVRLFVCLFVCLCCIFFVLFCFVSDGVNYKKKEFLPVRIEFF